VFREGLLLEGGGILREGPETGNGQQHGHDTGAPIRGHVGQVPVFSHG
jgi:hypothetical protein